jgi:hypothetical protein
MLCGKRAAVIDVEADPGFGRRIGVADARLRIGRGKIVEHGLVGDLAGQPYVARRHGARLRAHQHAAPMRRRAGDMRDPARAEASKMIADRLVGAREHQRCPVDQRAEEYLQAAVAADVVERSPDHRRRMAGVALDRAGEPGERMHHHLGRAARAGREHHPFGVAPLG